MRQLLRILTFLVILLSAGAAVAQQGSGVMAPQFDPTKPIHIQAGRLEADHGSQVVRFVGNVIVLQDDAALNCDILLLYYQAAEKPEPPAGEQAADPLGQLPETSGEIERLIALGRVRLVQGERQATAGRAEYNHEQQTITLTDNPLVMQGPNSISGSTILIHVPNQRVEVAGSRSQRVSVTINPRSAEEAARQGKERNQK